MPNEASVALTQTVKKGGCAAKLPVGLLRNTLETIKPTMLPEVVTGFETMEDAALYDLGNGLLLIQTLDFFTPMVDDPFDFGAIAAANALSDVYAMGGEPKTALSILAFPSTTLGPEILTQVMRGANQKIEEAGACLVGGHSIEDDTLKVGFSVAGFVARDKCWRNTGAQAGDAIILTKGIGTGTLCSALKNRQSNSDWTATAVRSMSQLNRVTDLIPAHTIHAATDITGFGLATHAFNIANASGKTIQLEMERVPTLPGAKECLTNKILNRAHRTNSEFFTPHASFDGSVTDVHRGLLSDPQTSGGLLLCVSANRASDLLTSLKSRFPQAEIIGKVCARTTMPLQIVC